MTQLGQFCAAGNNLSSIKTENGYNDCMLALDYAHNKVGAVEKRAIDDSLVFSPFSAHTTAAGIRFNGCK